MSKNLKHEWNETESACKKCGAIKGTKASDNKCKGDLKKGFDVWIYYVEAGWWREEHELSNIEDATNSLNEKIGFDGAVAGAVVPAGQTLNNFI